VNKPPKQETSTAGTATTTVEPVQIACAVTRSRLFDFAILYESARITWTYPLRWHVFVTDARLADEISAMDLPDVTVHHDLASNGRESEDDGSNVIELIE
jgi:hypothetical protein